MKYSVVIPIFNEESAISTTIEKVIDLFTRHNLECEVIAVDDGSSDNSFAILQGLEIKYPDFISVIRHPYNKGMGAALKTGIRAAIGEYIIWMDVDGQHDPEDLLSMFPHLPEYELVVGARPFIKDGTWYRNFANKFYNWLASSLTDFKIEDLTSGYRIFNADVVKKFYHLFPQRFSSATTSTLALLKGGYNIKYVPIHIQPRMAGSSKIRLFRDGFRFTMIIFKIILLFEPMRVFLPVTGIAFSLGLIGMILSIVRLARINIPNSSVVLYVLGVVSFLMGLLAEQLTAIQLAIIEDD